MTDPRHLQDERPDLPELGRHLLHHYQRRTLHDQQQAALDEHTPASPEIVTPAGDARKLRGIPTIARGVAGAVPGSSPGRTCHHCGNIHHRRRNC